MSDKINQFVREMQMGEAVVDEDLKNRILRKGLIATNNLCRDGWIIVPAGVDVTDYLNNRIVCARHMIEGGSRSPVIGRNLEMQRIETGFLASTQFADTELGREYAYLYGLNPEHEVYMRSWSINADVVEREIWSFAQARNHVGPDRWSAEVEESVRKWKTDVYVATRSKLNEYSAVPIGMDREALQRAHGRGIRRAGEMLTEMNFADARMALDILKREQETDRKRIEKLEAELQVLRSQGASAAAQRDSDAIRHELEGLLATMRKNESA